MSRGCEKLIIPAGLGQAIYKIWNKKKKKKGEMEMKQDKTGNILHLWPLAMEG